MESSEVDESVCALLGHLKINLLALTELWNILCIVKTDFIYFRSSQKPQTTRNQLSRGDGQTISSQASEHLYGVYFWEPPLKYR